MLVAVLLHGQDVAQHLGGMELVGQAVPHRHAGILGQDLDQFLAKPAIFDAVVHAPQHAGGIFHRFLVADLRAGWSQVGHMRALVIGGHFKGTARAGRGLLKDEGDVLTLEPRLLETAVLGGLEVGGQLEQKLEFFRRKVELLDEAAIA